jgi:folate-binding protein YgfZ
MKQRVLLVGADGHDLLTRISTLDISRLDPGQTAQGLILNPQGKIRASFLITPLETHRSILEFEPPFFEVLDQYTFAERYELIPQDPIAPHAHSIEKEKSELARIHSLTPALGKEFQHDESTNPLEVNLKSAIHDQKGCYPGQEVIEKILALGSPPKRLAKIELKVRSENPIGPLPQPLLDPETKQQVGTLTSLEAEWGLAILKRTHLSPGLLLLSPDGAQFQVIEVAP